MSNPVKPIRQTIKHYLSNKLSVIGTVVFCTILLSCLILPIFYPLDTNYQDTTQNNVAPSLNMLDIPSELSANARDISVGATFGVGVDSSGIVYQWGQLDSSLKDIPQFQSEIVQISAGTNHVLALDDDGNLYTWGYNRQGLGEIPTEIQSLDIKQIETGHQMSYVLTQQGELFYWGSQNLTNIKTDGYQGDIDEIAVNSNTVVALLKDGTVQVLERSLTSLTNNAPNLTLPVQSIAITERAVGVVTIDGQVHIWGSFEYGIQDMPVSVQGSAVEIVGGRNHFTVLTTDGKVFTWGRDNLNQTDYPTNGYYNKVYAGYNQSYAVQSNGENVVGWGLKGYLMGTDEYGRDIFIRLLTGGRTTMTIGAIAVIIASVIGVIIGGVSGYYGGAVDNILMRLAEIVSSIPFIPFAMILSALLGNSVTEMMRIIMIMVILGVLTWPRVARLVRGQILAEREKEYIMSAKSMGIKEMWIAFRYILPNVMTVVIVDITIAFATCMLTESGLSFLGFGVVEPNPTWGNMLSGALSSTVIANYWWRWVFPAIALSLSTISINLMGDGLREATDPRLRERT